MVNYWLTKNSSDKCMTNSDQKDLYHQMAEKERRYDILKRSYFFKKKELSEFVHYNNIQKWMISVQSYINFPGFVLNYSASSH